MEIDQFYIAGINYKKTDAAVRGQFAINQQQYVELTQKAAAAGIREFFILSTCNRTEIYGIAGSTDALINLLCSETAGTKEDFVKLCYVKSGNNAVNHLFDVAAGLDSQILGDYEIVGQIKQAARIAKENGFIGTFLERLLNSVLQTSKAIKSQTALSGGTVSVAFAAIQFLKAHITDFSKKNILVAGTGKIGSNTCKNLVDYLDTHNITLINRTGDKATQLAAELKLKTAPYEQLHEQLLRADIVIVATNSDTPVITKEHLAGSRPKVLIDLSIPNNIDPAVKELPGIILANVDDLSTINDITLQKRLAEVPKAKALIQEHIGEFAAWHGMRRHVPVLKAVKEKLHSINECPLFQSAYPQMAACYAPADAIQKVINNMAVKMRSQHQPGCYYIEAINDFITSRVN
ncbi:MAG TPA: glutamyl-tRNA reductase [Chitinophagaceae bacterium]|nr:glutamyl-tRNA reductase [Chitinophagaceae bacterium]